MTLQELEEAHQSLHAANRLLTRGDATAEQVRLAAEILVRLGFALLGAAQEKVITPATPLPRAETHPDEHAPGCACAVCAGALDPTPKFGPCRHGRQLTAGDVCQDCLSAAAL